MTASLRDQRRLHGPRGHHRIRPLSLPVSSLLQAGSLTMTLPTPSELPHPRCRQFCYRIVYRPSSSRSFKKANPGGVCRRSIPEWRDTLARFTFLVPFLSPLRGLGSTSPGYWQSPESRGSSRFPLGSRGAGYRPIGEARGHSYRVPVKATFTSRTVPGVRPCLGTCECSVMSLVEPAGRPAALSRSHPSGSRPDATGPVSQGPAPSRPRRDQNNVSTVPCSLDAHPAGRT